MTITSTLRGVLYSETDGDSCMSDGVNVRSQMFSSVSDDNTWAGNPCAEGVFLRLKIIAFRRPNIKCDVRAYPAARETSLIPSSQTDIVSLACQSQFYLSQITVFKDPPRRQKGVSPRGRDVALSSRAGRVGVL
jgi:hypothetical protein